MPRPQATPVVATKLERWNVETTKNITMLRDTPPEIVRVLRTALKSAHGGQITVNYGRGRSTPHSGRLYAKGPSLQSVPGWVRRLVADGQYHDIDMVNAAPTLLVGHCDRLGMAAPTLRRYVSEREVVLEELMGRHSIDRATAKKLVLLVLNFGNYHRQFEDVAHRDDPAEHVAILESTLAVTKRPYTCRVASSGVSPPQSTPQRSRRRWHGPPSEDCSLNFLLLFASHESEGCKFKTSCCLFSTLLLLCTTGRQSQR
jgi:hypothetical protein